MEADSTQQDEGQRAGIGSGGLVQRLLVECSQNYVICPHCGASYQPESGDFSESERDEECFTCKKTYQLWQSFEVYHHTAARAPLNVPVSHGGHTQSKETK